MKHKLKLWILRYLGFDKEIEKINQAVQEIQETKQEIIKRTDISVDPAVHKGGHNIVFVSGRYRGHDYVRLFKLPGGELSYLIEKLKDIEKSEYGKVRHIDSHINSFSTIIQQELDH